MRVHQYWILVYSITNRQSFEYLNRVREYINDDHPSIVLVGNKSDLEKDREIGRQEGQEMADRFGNCLFIEASAKENINVTEIFHSISKLIDYKTDFEKEGLFASKRVIEAQRYENKPKNKCLIMQT